MIERLRDAQIAVVIPLKGVIGESVPNPPLRIVGGLRCGVILMLPKLDLPRALLRGRYMAAAARMEWNGVPIDTAMLAQFRAHWTKFRNERARPSGNSADAIWLNVAPGDDQFAAAAAAVRNTAAVDQIARLTWRAHAEGQIIDAEAEAVSEALQARRAAFAATERTASPSRPALGLPWPAKRPRSPDRQAHSSGVVAKP